MQAWVEPQSLWFGAGKLASYGANKWGKGALSITTKGTLWASSSAHISSFS